MGNGYYHYIQNSAYCCSPKGDGENGSDDKKYDLQLSQKDMYKNRCLSKANFKYYKAESELSYQTYPTQVYKN